MVGVFPPPAHGQSLSNDELRGRLASSGDPPSIVDLSPDSASRSWRVRFGRLIVVLKGLLRFVSLIVTTRGGSVVISMSASFGLAYELIFTGLARCFRWSIFLHHHNYTYVDDPYLLMRLMTVFAGPRATHIVLCERMEEAMKRSYAGVRRTVALSNVVFLDAGEEGSETKLRRRLEVLGYLSNITAEKGIFEFLETMEELERRGVRVSSRIAGPIEDSVLRSEVLSRIDRLASAEYVGARHGAGKAAFYCSIDLFLFPSRSEAEGRVNHEAMRAGVPVIAPARGCIPDVIGEDGGFVVNTGEDFVKAASERIESWVRNPALFEAASRSAFLRYHKTKRETLRRLDALCLQIENG